MKSSFGFSQSGLLARLAIFVVLLAVAIAAGLYLGRISVSITPDKIPSAQPGAPTTAAKPDASQKEGGASEEAVPDQAPLFLHVGGKVQENLEVTQAQVTLATNAGFNRFAVPVALDWSEPAEATAGVYNALLEPYVKVNGNARLLLCVDLNPPAAWLERHPEAAIKVNDTLQAYPSIASKLWRDSAQQLLEVLIREVESGPFKERVSGYELIALTDQRWKLTDEFDRSETNTAGFRAWLERAYNNEDALRRAWNMPEASFVLASIPTRPAADTECNALVQVPEQQPLVDFYRYCSERVADAIAGFASLTARVSTVKPLILAPYGHSYEAMASGSGHFGVELLLGSDITGLVSPVSYFDRGLGGVGGMMGAIDSLKARGKTWYIVDDTRTGMERAEDTGKFARIKGIRPQDIYEVQRRNFAMAVTYGLGLIWSDPQGEGWLNDEEQWTQFSLLKDIYEKRIADGGENPQGDENATVTVVVDESSNFYLQCAEHMNAVLLQRGRDAVLRSGVSTRFHLLRDVVEGVAPPTPVYLFLNAFHLSEEDRTRLHSRLTMEKACAIWVYAPGYFGGAAPSVENIRAVTRMTVQAFDKPTQSGSRYLLPGGYMMPEETFGTQEVWSPLFYVEPTEDVDFLARYTSDEKKGSIAMLGVSEGWTSVYIAEPELTPALLSELFRMLELPMYPNLVESALYDAIFARGSLLAVHASKVGKRSLYLGGFCNILDLLKPEIGLYQKDNILLPMQQGETRLLLREDLPVEENS